MLAGIGLTTGENMPRANFQEKEDWAFEPTARACSTSLEEQPERHFTLIHRQHEAGPRRSPTFAPLVAHPNVDFSSASSTPRPTCMSSTTQTFHPEFVDDITGRRPEDDLDPAQRRHLPIPLGRAGLRPGVHREHPPRGRRGFYYGSDQ